ncbi:hypothetical protein K461DRAFT_306408 [Myriangium duriaei CBS 260.36]|uniref:Uncharacterized protein n=1 Tax=Myriangium duriaei CBS 260.36 TaxID=1168546 RepID=A0A9P4J2I8_9PEZI|nr:hypothetical protein K461DRAFT_306408 [Myriangium duriaei CBS 260.36]
MRSPIQAVTALTALTLCLASNLNGATAAVVKDSCSAADVKTVKSAVTDYVYFCTFYTSRGRVLSPFATLDKTQAYNACTCIKNSSPAPPKASVLPAPTGKGFGPDGTCFTSDINVLKSEFKDPTPFCNLYSAWSANNDPLTPIPSLTGTRMYNACQCFLQKITAPVTTTTTKKATTTTTKKQTTTTTSSRKVTTTTTRMTTTTTKSTSTSTKKANTTTMSTSTSPKNPASTSTNSPAKTTTTSMSTSTKNLASASTTAKTTTADPIPTTTSVPPTTTTTANPTTTTTTVPTTTTTTMTTTMATTTTISTTTTPDTICGYSTTMIANVARNPWIVGYNTYHARHWDGGWSLTNSVMSSRPTLSSGAISLTSFSASNAWSAAFTCGYMVVQKMQVGTNNIDLWYTPDTSLWHCFFYDSSSHTDGYAVDNTVSCAFSYTQITDQCDSTCSD